MKLILVSLLVALAFNSGCAKSQSSAILAKVGNRVITLQEAQERMAKLPPYYQSIVARDKRKFVDDLIIEELFYEEALRQGLARDRETQEIIKEAKKKILSAKLIKKEVEDKIKINPAVVRKYYDENKGDFRSPPMWRASHVLVPTEGEAKEIADGLNSAGWNFEEIAKARSMDATAERGGDVGYFTKGQIIPEFEEACLKMKVADPCQVIKTQFGYHVIKLTDTKPERSAEFDKVKGIIEDRLKRDVRKDLFNKLVTDLKTRYAVSVDEGAVEVFEQEQETGERKGDEAK